MCRLPHLWMGVWFCGLVDGWVFLLTFCYLTAYLKHLSPLQGYFLALHITPGLNVKQDPVTVIEKSIIFRSNSWLTAVSFSLIWCEQTNIE